MAQKSQQDSQEAQPLRPGDLPYLDSTQIERTMTEVRRSTVKQKREMEMGVKVRKGEAPIIFKYTREDM